MDFEGFMSGILAEWEKMYGEASHSATNEQEGSNEVIGSSRAANTPDLIVFSDDED